MIFAFGDDRMIQVLVDEAEARKEWEPLDVESSAVVFYEEDGTWLKPDFIKPNRKGIFGSWIQGEYRLVPSASMPPEIDSIDVALDEAVGVAPNPHFDSVDAIRRHVRERRAR